MKYKVIGWTYYDNSEIPFSDKTIGFAERHAIIDDIVKNKYLFSGWHHQESWDNCVPILNDGKKRGFSQRGWGGLMAEAYGEMDDFSYVGYTFQESIDYSDLCFPLEEYDINNFESKPIENEHFDINVSKELFDIAKKKNPFYLEDHETLRYIETNDTITLHYNDETLTFLVNDVDRNKKEVKFSKHHLIDGKYKIIITHKPMAKVLNRVPLLISNDNVNETFKKAIKDYDFLTLLELFDSYNINKLVKNRTDKIISILKKFVLEYSDYAFEIPILNKLLMYINDFEFYKEIALKVMKYNTNIFISFVNKYYSEGINVDEYIPLAVKLNKGTDYYITNLLLRAIDLNPNNKSYRKRYYKELKYSDFNSFIICVGSKDFKLLSKEDRKLVELENFDKLSPTNIHNIAKLMFYPNPNIVDNKNYPYKVPSFYSSKYQCIKDGILEYQKYINETYNLYDRLEELLILGIRKRGEDMDQYLNGEENVSYYVYSLDILSEFKYSLREKAEQIYPNLKKYLDEIYK